MARFYMYMLARRNRHVHDFHIFQQEMYDFLTVISQIYGKQRTLGQFIGLTDAYTSVTDSCRLKLNLKIKMFTHLQMMKYSMLHL